MLFSRLFWKLFLTYALLTLLTAVGFVFAVSQRQQALLESQNQRRLHHVAVLFRESLRDRFPTEPSPALQRRLEQLGEETGTRLTVIHHDGTILGDSAEDPRLMENHANRGELIQADRGDAGVVRRQSQTTGISMLYFALPVRLDQQTLGFVRVSTDVAGIQAESAALQNRIFTAAALVSLIAVLLTYFIVARIVQPLLTLTKAAEAVAVGQVTEAVEIPNHDEIGTLAAAFNSMNRQLTDRIHELQRKTKELEENGNRLSTVLAGMIEGVIAVDQSERILFANRAARPLLDLSRGGAIGRPIWEAIRHQTVHHLVRETLAGREQPPVEFEVPRSQAVMAMLAARMPGHPCPGVVLVMHDVTELRKLENLRHEFVSNVSHELKTPLTAIQTITETLLDGAMNDPLHAQRFLERIAEQAERLHVLILDLLNLAKIESGREVFEVAAIPLDPLIEECVEEHRAVAAAKQVALSAVPPELALEVEAETEGVRMILNNLIDNAIKAVPAQGRVTVRWFTEDGEAVIVVEDTGVGIAPEHQERIFERFYRVDKARSRELGGTGLGLSIVKHLTQVFKGSVSVSSQIGRGSAFSVRLPLA